MGNYTHTFRKMNLQFSSYKNWELKIKLWWVGACETKKGVFFVTFTFCEGNFFNICILSQCILYWNFQNIYTFYISKKHYFIYFFCSFLKSSKALSGSLNTYCNWNIFCHFHLLLITSVLFNWFLCKVLDERHKSFHL